MLFCIDVGFIGLKVQTHFYQDVLSVSYNIFNKVIKVIFYWTCFVRS